ncbi:ABC transporter ATP-binding protein [Bacillus tianshenii]|nr:ABC transporter ATP-binding protein [Bacillus tianshenii]
MIDFKDVTKIYDGKVKALENINFHVPKGNIVVFLGPSGCGKTTLLRMVNRLVSITEGEILIDGQPNTSLNEIELRRNIGYVIQSNGLFPNMTIEENVMAVPDLLGWGKKEKRERFDYLMNLMGLDPKEYRKRYPHELSGGQQQRIGIARAMAADPPVMLMDEPFGALDPIIRSHIQDEFLQIQKEVKKTILFVSHDIDEAIKMGDKICIFKDGQLMQYDTPSDLLTSPNNDFVETFIGDDRALKSLSLHTTADLIAEQDLQHANANMKNKQIPVHTNLRNAISMLLNQEADELHITDEHNDVIGALTLNDIQTYLHEHITS